MADPIHLQLNRRFNRRAALVLGAGLLLAGCSPDAPQEDDANRQFANGPVSGQNRPTTVPPTNPPAVTSPARTGAATPVLNVVARGAPDVIYTLDHGQLAAVRLEGLALQATPLALPDGAIAASWDASPRGDTVGVLQQDARGAYAIRFYGPDGIAIGPPFALADVNATPAATNVATPMPALPLIPAAPAVSWIPQSEGVGVVLNGHILMVDHVTGVTTPKLTGLTGTVVAARWAPTGDRLLVQTCWQDGSGHFFLIEIESGQAQELPALTNDPGDVTPSWEWLPSGRGIVYLRGRLLDGQVLRADLFSFTLESAQSRLLGTSGVGGPSAAITDIQISPDGKEVAYSVSLRDGAVWTFHSLWLVSLGDPASRQLPVRADAPLTNLQFVNHGLIWTALDPQQPGSERLDGFVADRQLAPPTSSAATPVGTPEASPAATPVG